MWQCDDHLRLQLNRLLLLLLLLLLNGNGDDDASSHREKLTADE